MKMNLKLTADELMNVVDAAVEAARERDYMIDEEELIKDMTYIIDAALSAMGIEITEDADTEEVDAFGVPVDYDSDFDFDKEEEKKPECVDLDLDNPVAQCVFIHEGKRAIKQSDADQIVKTITEVVDANFDFLPDEIKQKIRAGSLLKIFKDNGVEIVVMGE